MIYLYYQIDHNFRNLTKSVLQFLDTYMNLYQLYKSSSEIEMEKLLLIPKKKKIGIQLRGPRGHGPRRGSPRTLVLLQKSPRTSPELHLSPNTISSSLWRIYLTPWVFINFPAHTPGQLCVRQCGEQRHKVATRNWSTWAIESTFI